MKDDPYLRWMISLELDIAHAGRLLKRFGSGRAVFAHGARGDARLDAKVAAAANRGQLEAANRSGDFEFISRDNPKFPLRLKNIKDSPLGLFVKGNIPENFEHTPVVAIIGSRDNSIYGRQVTTKIAADLAKLGIIIASGMARGLDAYAHSAALSAGGPTIAVLPSGIDVCYPPSNSGLYRKIPSHGAVLTEFPMGFRPQKWSFPARNRIISALADVLIVTEARAKSGTFTTVNHALNQGKEVLAVPGNILVPHSVGTNLLIKEGAGVITSYLDALVALKNQKHLHKFFEAAKPEFSRSQGSFDNKTKNLPLATDEALVYSCINYEPQSIEYIVKKTNLDVAAVNKCLFDLELSGMAKKLAGNNYIKV
ncbi:MAG: DNA-processing protein DprA [Defluviitaleaceae bacterium]|nr:DNA-processing protein DprA [Defluviitaleaceae bacterium]